MTRGFEQPRYRYPDRVRLPLTFDPAPLADDIASLGDLAWTPHFVRQNYQGEWSALPLRASREARHPILMIAPHPHAKDFVDTPLLGRLPNIAAALAAFRCPLQCVRLMRLAPGSDILEHSDPDLEAEAGWARIHVPILTNPDVSFSLNREPVAMAPGETWYLRLSDPHSAANRGATDRIHLVIDARVDDWLAAQLESGAAGARLRRSASPPGRACP